MMRSFIRLILAAVCLLSLLAAAGVSWLWWECRHGRGYVADASFSSTYLTVELLPGSQVGVLIVRNWPGPTGLRVWSQRAFYAEHPIYWASARMRPWHRLRLSGQTGQLAVFFRTDTGDTVRWDTVGRMPPAALVKSSGWMPAWSVGNIPPWLVITGLLVPPLLFEGLRWRRVRERHRRVRLGLCLACGYDLRESPERCPEMFSLL
jgi:hypothetical protein